MYGGTGKEQCQVWRVLSQPHSKVFVHCDWYSVPRHVGKFSCWLLTLCCSRRIRRPPLFTLHCKWDISEAALIYDRPIPLNLKHFISSVGTQIGMLLMFPHFPPLRRNCCEDWADAANGYSIHTDKCVKWIWTQNLICARLLTGPPSNGC